MSKHTTGSLLWGAFKALLIAVLKLCALIIAWLLKFASLLFAKVSEAIEKIVIKRL